MSRLQKRNDKEVAKMEKYLTYSVIFVYISIVLYFINSNFKFLIFLSLGYTLLTLMRDFNITDKSKRFFFN